MKDLGKGPGYLGIFDGSPPVPPFSMSGSKRKGWSWGVLTEDGDMETMKHLWSKKESRIDDLPMKRHDDCKVRHYTDPYSKFEYCLPEDFWDAPASYVLNNYRVLCN